RLPTEAEWEFAARGGTQSSGYTYAGSNDVDAVAWHSGNAGSTTHIVGAKSPNELGLYDMSGNVFEWCWDWYGSYSSTTQTNPTGASSGSYRIGRSSSWKYSAEYCRTTLRGHHGPTNHDELGIRVARNLIIPTTENPNGILYSNDFSTNPNWNTNNSSRYFWNSSVQAYSTENYTNSGDWATTPVDYSGDSFRYTVDIKPTERDTGDVCFGLFDANKNSNSNTGEKAYVLLGGYSPVVYLYAVSQTGSTCVSAEGTMQLNKWHSITVTYDSDTKNISIEVKRDSQSVLSWSGTISGGFSSDLDYLGVSMNGSWSSSGRFEKALIDNVKLVSPYPLYKQTFDENVFADSSWSRTNSSIAVDTGADVLRISPNGSYGDKTWTDLSSLNLNFPLVIQSRMRLTAGGRNYLLPCLSIFPTTAINGVGADGAVGVTFLPSDTYGWLLGTYTTSQLNPLPAEGTWATVVATIRTDGGTLSVQLDGQSTPTAVAASSWSIAGPLWKLGFSQPWDSTCEISYVSVGVP
ncbi:MAG TPA: hypothetical protein DHV69_02715, partial [Sphaerochaeta sp.]|nr:hypothetical protein [Sphaerochaeta sp.]